MSKIIATIEGHDITENDDGTVTYTAKAAIDNDGSGGNSEGDPDHQDETSLRLNGKSINAETVPYVVVPPALIRGVAPVVLGCKAVVSYQGKKTDAVVADRGPATKIGEISVQCAKRLGINPSPLHGGVSSGVSYTLFPGVSAIVDGIHYQLQPS